MAWMLRGIVDATGEKSEALVEKMIQLVALFEENPRYYSSASFLVFDRCQNALEQSSKELPAGLLKQWQKDQPLLLMGQKIRQLIQTKMAK